MRLHRKKRPRALVSAFRAAMRRTGVRARLLIAGIGPEERDLLHDIGRSPSGDTPAVRLLGWKSPDELRDLYGAADGFAIASRNESFGIATLEARAAGLPVIAMRAAGSREFLDDSRDALLCDDDDALVGALSRFLEDAELRKRMRTPTSRLSRYDWANVVARHQETYAKARALGTTNAGTGGG
jgi:glycosyltransferase involved in cell wall biosynthesis